MSKLLIKTVLGLALALGLLACSATYRDHGYMPTQTQLDKIVVGVDNRDSLLELLGPPMSTGVGDDNSWYFISSRVKTYGAFEHEVIDRTLLAISFNSTGTVSNVETFGLEDGEVVTLSRRVTDQPVRGQGLLSQVFGNIGNIRASDLFE